MQVSNELKQKYRAATDSFLEKARADHNVIAVYIYGSLVRGDLWEGSDLDIIVVTKDQRGDRKIVVVVEDGIVGHADVLSRSAFRRSHERVLRGSQGHHVFTSGKLLWTSDESLHDYYQEVSVIGEQDRELLAMRYAVMAIADMNSAKKSLYCYQDSEYAFIWLLEVIKSLAGVETVLNGQGVQREVIRQALACNPEAFKALSTDLIHGEKDLPAMKHILSLVDDYLAERAELIFRPLLAFLKSAGNERGASEVLRHFANRLLLQNHDFRLIGGCEWLVEKGYLGCVSSSVKLTTKGRFVVDEPAYFYNGA
jgi:predicted nucleotidyltransferase